MEVLDNLQITGNSVCLICGYGETCPKSSLPLVFGDDVTVTPDKFCKVEDQTELWDRAGQLGQEIAKRI